MVKNGVLMEYQEYCKKIGDRLTLYELVAKKFSVERALYPGSHIDITPSLIIPDVTYVDNYKGAISFFKNSKVIKDFVEEKKRYRKPSKITFIGEDYTNNLSIESVDLIISQYAGFVGQATKQYLKKDGILLCNDSHGDATLAKHDADFVLIGVIKNHRVITTNLEQYFQLPKEKTVNLKNVRETMKGPKYRVMVKNYLFRKK